MKISKTIIESETDVTSETSDKHLEAILEVVQAVAKGDYNHELEIDAQGIISHLAVSLNQIVLNLRQAQPSLGKASEDMPVLADTAQNILQMMHNSTQTVLDRADEMLKMCESCSLNEQGLTHEQLADCVDKMKANLFDIISAQSYQDAARQQMEKLEKKIVELRDALFKVVAVLNLKKSEASYNLLQSQKILIDVQKTPVNAALSQDVIDELLAEFGL